ncbi:uncharacterized protein Triagg1_7007 [Trichoderma aggressivum f. europaeum]|uniref:Uncharacterized protein n=1 Tax=Trichoderma aggressivum f. europaeum TaxID=173218 RepID=A0AAE1IAM9_9HYPO|nr:hypothetical protein Triagg1_7007 [Trichoderma aggressivum f. europaeum]
MAVPSRRQARAASRASRTTASSMARSRNSTTASSRYYASSRQHDQTSSYVSGSYYDDSRHSSRDTWERDTWEDLPPSIVDTGSDSSSSVYTYDSAYSDDRSSESHHDSDSDKKDAEGDNCAVSGIPPSTLPPYNCMPVPEISVRSSDPETFAHLFPSMDRLTIRHDDRTADGNMNLRVDAIVPDNSSRRRRAVAIQLFHLRMHDLAKREFSLRRYCRDSGREVCNSKGANPHHERAATSSSSSLSRSVTSALRSVKTSFRRSSGAAAEKAAAVAATPNPRRPSIGSNNSWGCGGSIYSEDVAGSDSDEPKLPSARPIPLNTLKLEFSNYARVDIVRRPGKQYDFQWWGHTYAWRRVMDKALGKAAFHLIRDKETEPVAVITPEGRAPNQVEADQAAGNWIPPCYMWINDSSIIEALTDVADVIIATGLIAVVDDSILSRWPPAKKAGTHTRPTTPARPHTAPGATATATAAPSTAVVSKNITVSAPQPRTKALVHGLLNKAHALGPLRNLRGHTVLAY